MSPAPWECPDCYTANLSRAATCEVCGYERHKLSSGRAAQPVDLRCVWTTRGARCSMPGTIGTTSPHCTWHSFDPRGADNVEEFERWVAQLRDAKYCAVWTHTAPVDLWRAVRGEAALPPDAVACLASSCPYRPAPPVASDWRRAITLATANARARRGAPGDPEPVSAIIPPVPEAAP